jgi:hypothetical protein
VKTISHSVSPANRTNALRDVTLPLSSKREGGPWLLDLGLASHIDPQIAAWNAQLRTGQLSPDAAGLRRALIDRLWPLLLDGKGLILAADGEFLNVPLDLLPTEEGLLLDRFEIRHVLCGRDLLRRGRPPRPRSACSGRAWACS